MISKKYSLFFTIAGLFCILIVTACYGFVAAILMISPAFV
jgi:hypothetical protein